MPTHTDAFTADETRSQAQTGGRVGDGALSVGNGSTGSGKIRAEMNWTRIRLGYRDERKFRIPLSPPSSKKRLSGDRASYPA